MHSCYASSCSRTVTTSNGDRTSSQAPSRQVSGATTRSSKSARAALTTPRSELRIHKNVRAPVRARENHAVASTYLCNSTPPRPPRLSYRRTTMHRPCSAILTVSRITPFAELHAVVTLKHDGAPAEARSDGPHASSGVLKHAARSTTAGSGKRPGRKSCAHACTQHPSSNHPHAAPGRIETDVYLGHTACQVQLVTATVSAPPIAHTQRHSSERTLNNHVHLSHDSAASIPARGLTHDRSTHTYSHSATQRRTRAPRGPPTCGRTPAVAEHNSSRHALHRQRLIATIIPQTSQCPKTCCCA